MGPKGKGVWASLGQLFFFQPGKASFFPKGKTVIPAVDREPNHESVSRTRKSGISYRDDRKIIWRKKHCWDHSWAVSSGRDMGGNLGDKGGARFGCRVSDGPLDFKNAARPFLLFFRISFWRKWPVTGKILRRRGGGGPFLHGVCKLSCRHE